MVEWLTSSWQLYGRGVELKSGDIVSCGVIICPLCVLWSRPGDCRSCQSTDYLAVFLFFYVFAIIFLSSSWRRLVWPGPEVEMSGLCGELCNGLSCYTRSTDLSLSQSFYVSLLLYVCMSLSLSFVRLFPSSPLSPCVCLSLSLSLCVCLSFFLTPPPSLYPPLSIYVFVRSAVLLLYC